MSSFTLIDDRDAAVSYSGSWTPGGTAREHEGTVSSSLKVGDSFTVAFTGTRIGVYGTFDSSSAGVKASYAIDGGSADAVTSGSSGGDSYQQLFWQSDALAPGAHSLKVTMLTTKPNVGEFEGTIWFDYFNVTHGALAAAGPSSGGGSSDQASATGGGGSKKPQSATGTSASAASSSTDSVTTVAAPAGKSNAGAIAGAVIGVLLVLLLVAGFFFWRRRRQNQEKYFPAPSMAHTPSGGVPPTQQPFLNQNRASTPMSGVAGSTVGLYANSAAASSTGGFDARLTHAQPMPAGAQAPYDPYASIGASMFPSNASAPPTSYAPSSYAPSVTAASSAALSAAGRRPQLSVVGGSTVDGDSIAELKRRQKEMVDSYENGVASGSGGKSTPIQHVDSGFRGDSLDKHTPEPAELPPVYTPN